LQELNKETRIGVLGAGTMGTGIAQIAATYGHKVYVYDNNETVLRNSED
jgi:3-hydroxybutyryl-CoA dehydrogenase